MYFIEMLLCELNCWWSVCMLQTIAYMVWELPTHTSHKCMGTSILIAMVSLHICSLKAYPISPTFPKKPQHLLAR